MSMNSCARKAQLKAFDKLLQLLPLLQGEFVGAYKTNTNGTLIVSFSMRTSFCVISPWISNAIHIDHPVISDIFAVRVIFGDPGILAPETRFFVPTVNYLCRIMPNPLTIGCGCAVDDYLLDVHTSQAFRITSRLRISGTFWKIATLGAPRSVGSKEECSPSRM